MTTQEEPWGMNCLRLALPLLFLGLAACTSGGTISADSFLASEDESGATSDGFPAPSKVVVWETAMRTVREQGYVPDPSASSPLTGKIVSRWRLSLQPFSGQGWRERVSMKIEPIPGKKDYYRLDTNVLRQLNDNLTEPGNPLATEWGEGARNTQREQFINQRIEMTFLPGDVSPEFRSKYDLPSKQDPRQRAPAPPKKSEGPFPGLPFP
jgi:hypothetical protein